MRNRLRSDGWKKIIDTALHDDAGYARLAYLCDRIGNRLSGSKSMPSAVSWSAEEMKKAGLTNVVTPPVMVPHWVRGKETGPMFQPIERPLHFSWCIPTPVFSPLAACFVTRHRGRNFRAREVQGEGSNFEGHFFAR